MTTTLLIATLLTATPGISLSDAPRAELRLRDLDAGRPSLAGTIVLFSIGVPFFGAGVALAAYGASMLGFVSSVAGVGALFAGAGPYFLIGFAAIFGILPGVILIAAGIQAAIARQWNVTETRVVATRLNDAQAVPMRTVATF